MVSRSFQLAIDELISTIICTSEASRSLHEPSQALREQVAKSFLQLTVYSKLMKLVFTGGYYWTKCIPCLVRHAWGAKRRWLCLIVPTGLVVRVSIIMYW